jgi:hypothetical protein
MWFFTICSPRRTPFVEKILLSEIHLRRAFIFFLQKDYVSSDRKFRAVLELSEIGGGWYFRGNALWGIGKNLMIQGNMTKLYHG